MTVSKSPSLLEPVLLSSGDVYALMADLRAGAKLSNRTVALYSLLQAWAPNGIIIMPYQDNDQPEQPKVVRKLGKRE